MKVLIAGGAGYIGSTIASACLDAGITPVIVDNLQTGIRDFVEDRIFYKGDIADRDLIDEVFKDHPDLYAVVLCAALINVPDSIVDPVSYYHGNVSKCLAFVSHLIRNGCDRLIFSSSASIYGSGAQAELNEDSAIVPMSPYARTKAFFEFILQDIVVAEPLRVLSLRYFNPIGADPKMRTGLQLRYPSHALGKMIEALGSCRAFEITGTDYPTRDGSGVRDYVHVWDLAEAHVLSLSKFDSVFAGERRYEAINLGAGSGVTVYELVNAFNEVASAPIEFIETARRPGDIAGAYTTNEKAFDLLGWKPKLTLADGIRDALKWYEMKWKSSND